MIGVYRGHFGESPEVSCQFSANHLLGIGKLSYCLPKDDAVYRPDNVHVILKKRFSIAPCGGGLRQGKTGNMAAAKLGTSPVSAEELVPSIAANLPDGFRSQVPACGDARRFPDRVIDLCKENV